MCGVYLRDEEFRLAGVFYGGCEKIVELWYCMFLVSCMLNAVV